MCHFFAPPERFTGLTHSRQIFDPEVAFTEIINFDFAYPVDLEDDCSQLGQLWKRMIDMYLCQPGVKELGWGQYAESSQNFKLIIDWTSQEDREQSLANPEVADLSMQWRACQVPFESSNSSFFHPSPDTYRADVLAVNASYDSNHVSVFLTFHFSPTFDSTAIVPFDMCRPQRSKLEMWKHGWVRFRQAVWRNNGALTGAAEGWWDDKYDEDAARGGKGMAFMAVFRFVSLDSAQSFFNRALDRPSAWCNPWDLIGCSPWDVGGLGTLRKLADDKLAVKIESVQMAYTRASYLN